MVLPELCIRRPVLATVMSLSLLLFGVVGYSRLPVRELPNIEFPIVSVSTVLPGASAEVVETEITEILEEELNGIEGIDVLSSVSREQVSTITLRFELNRDIDTAAEDVRDRVARVRGRLPEDAKEPSVAKFDVSAETIMWIALFSDTRDTLELREIGDKLIKPRLQTVSGVGRVRLGGSNQPAMRIELDRDLLAAHALTVGDVVAALRGQNVEIPSGRVEGQWREFVVQTKGEFDSPEGFARLIVSYRDASPVRLGNLAKIRVGFVNERTHARFNGVATIGLGIVKQSRANTLAVANGVKSILEDLHSQLPDGVTMQIAFDQSPFIEQSVREVQETLWIAGLLVVLVIFVFLQSARSTIIPSIAMPVAIISTFGVIYFLGFTINNLVLMGLTLVIGVVVDDAIIVLENVYRHMEEGAERRQAALTASSEIAFAVISTTLTLVAVFVPIAFLGGTVGRFFYEFGVSVIVAVSVSSFVALTLTPMLCSRFLSVGSTAARSGTLGSIARRFDTAVERLSQRYERILEAALGRRALMVAILLAAVAISVGLFQAAGKEFITQDDRGYFMVSVKTPEGSTIAYQDRYQRRVEKLLDQTPEVLSYFSIVAIGRGGPGRVNDGLMFVRMQPMELRQRHASEVLGGLRRQAGEIAGANVFFFQFNPLRRGGGSKPVGFVIQHSNFDILTEYAQKLRDAVAEMPGFTDVDTDLEINKPQLDVTFARDKARALGISVADIADTLKILLGGDAISTYKKGNERYDVIAQLSAGDRFDAQDLSNIYVRTSGGEIVPLRHLVEVKESVGPSSLRHYSRKRSVTLDANLDGIDMGHALEQLSSAAASILPEGFTTTLSGESREYEKSSRGLAFTFVLAIIAIYLVLAAQFESFVHPITIMLALPLATFGALAGLVVFGMPLSVYSYIGLIMLMGLVTKNSILLVDYINILRGRGVDTRQAILKSGRTRLRPILMTAISTIFGILPIALGLGSGAEGRRPLGIAVVVGLTTSTLLTLVVVPVVYSLLDELTAAIGKRKAARAATSAARAH